MTDALVMATPMALALALLVPLALARARRRGPPAARFAPAALLAREPLPATWRTRLAALPDALAAAGLLLAIVALARPVARVPLPPRAEGVDVLVCLDVSSSMTSRDMDARRTRLDLAKEAAARFVAGRPQDRIGLVTFARYPDVVCPPTLDHAALARMLARVETVPGDGPEDATGLGAAVARAAQVLAGGRARSKVVVLLTDGEENVATARTPREIAPVHAAQLCERLGVRVHAIAAGVGRRDAQGRWVALDTSALVALADRTGGAFFEARDARAIAAVYAAIDELETVTFEDPRHATEERFVPWLVAGLGLLALGETLRRTRLEVLP